MASGGVSGIKYNAKSKVFLYVLPGNRDLIQGTDFMTRLLRYIQAPFNSLLGKYKQMNPDDTEATKYNTLVIPNFNRIYLMRKGTKIVYAVQERLNITDRAMLNYTGFTTDICGVITPSIPAGTGTCSEVGSTSVLLLRRNAGEENRIFDMWPQLTSGLRVN
jgi:hypothetical protein